MKLRFFWKQFPNTIDSPRYYDLGEIVGNEVDFENPYRKYLVAAFSCDIRFVDYCEKIFVEIAKVQRGELEKTGWSGNAFDTIIYCDRVEIDHQQFAGHPDWPTWTCPLPVFMQALKGWMEFLKLPVNAESSLVVDLNV